MMVTHVVESRDILVLRKELGRRFCTGDTGGNSMSQQFVTTSKSSGSHVNDLGSGLDKNIQHRMHRMHCSNFGTF